MVDGLHGQTARVNDFGTLIINIYYEIIYMQIKKNIGYIKKISITVRSPGGGAAMASNYLDSHPGSLLC